MHHYYSEFVRANMRYHPGFPPFTDFWVRAHSLRRLQFSEALSAKGSHEAQKGRLRLAGDGLFHSASRRSVMSLGKRFRQFRKHSGVTASEVVGEDACPVALARILIGLIVALVGWMVWTGFDAGLSRRLLQVRGRGSRIQLENQVAALLEENGESRQARLDRKRRWRKARRTR